MPPQVFNGSSPVTGAFIDALAVINCCAIEGCLDMQTASPDFAQLKSNVKARWMAGDVGQIANFIVKAAEDFVARTQISFGTRILDIALRYR